MSIYFHKRQFIEYGSDIPHSALVCNNRSKCITDVIVGYISPRILGGYLYLLV